MRRLVELVLDVGVRELCWWAYPNHPRGCPNYGRRDGCPPAAPLIGDVLDLTEDVWAIWIEFDLAAHRERMLVKHPQWSKQQTDCCLYWQGRANAELHRRVVNFCISEVLFEPVRPWTALYCPEAMGVNVTETMRNVGVELEWPPENIVRKIAIVGIEKGVTL